MTNSTDTYKEYTEVLRGEEHNESEGKMQMRDCVQYEYVLLMMKRKEGNDGEQRTLVFGLIE